MVAATRMQCALLNFAQTVANDLSIVFVLPPPTRVQAVVAAHIIALDQITNPRQMSHKNWEFLATLHAQHAVHAAQSRRELWVWKIAAAKLPAFKHVPVATMAAAIGAMAARVREIPSRSWRVSPELWEFVEMWMDQHERLRAP
jgi:hypothetical protein